MDSEAKPKPRVTVIPIDEEAIVKERGYWRSGGRFSIHAKHGSARSKRMSLDSDNNGDRY